MTPELFISSMIKLATSAIVDAVKAAKKEESYPRTKAEKDRDYEKSEAFQKKVDKYKAKGGK